MRRVLSVAVLILAAGCQSGGGTHTAVPPTHSGTELALMSEHDLIATYWEMKTLRRDLSPYFTEMRRREMFTDPELVELQNGQVHLGMPVKAAFVAWGLPEDMTTTETANGNVQRVVWLDRYSLGGPSGFKCVTAVDGRIASITR